MKLKNPVLSVPQSICFIAVFICLFPVCSYAWGPATHLSWVGDLVESLFIISGGGILSLIKKNLKNFLYGNVIADVVIAKNLAGPEDHSHNWVVIQRMLDRVVSDQQKATVFGFLTHLAADTVAHNIFLPFYIMAVPSGKIFDHAYLEIVVERLQPDKVWTELKSLLNHDFDKIDSFIDENIKKTLFKKYGTNKFVFKTAAFNKDITSWLTRVKSRIGGVDEGLIIQLTSRMRDISKRRMFSILMSEGADIDRLENPSGIDNMKLAKSISKALKSRRIAGQKEAVDSFIKGLIDLLWAIDPMEKYMTRVVSYFQKHFNLSEGGND